MRRWWERKFEVHFVIHFTVRCNSHMMKMIKRIRTIEDAELIFKESNKHKLLNATDEPSLHIAARESKLEAVKHLLFEASHLLNVKFDVMAHTLLHSAVDDERRHIIDFLMSKDRKPRVDHHAKNIHDSTSLKCALRKSISIAQPLYDVMTAQDKSNLNVYDLLDIIVQQHEKSLKVRLNMTARIIKKLNYESRNECCNLYNVAVDSYMCELNSEEKNAKQYQERAIRMWRLMHHHRVTLQDFDSHDTTSIAHAIQNASLVFVKNLVESSNLEIQRTSWSTIDKNGDTFYDIAKRREESSILSIVKEQIARDSLKYFLLQKNYRSVAEIYYTQKYFIKCLECLDQLQNSDWKKCIKARTFLKLRKCEVALKSFARMKECAIVLRLKSFIFLEKKNYKTTFSSSRLTYEKKSRFAKKIALRRQLCSIDLLLASLATDLSFEIKKCEQINELWRHFEKDRSSMHCSYSLLSFLAIDTVAWARQEMFEMIKS